MKRIRVFRYLPEVDAFQVTPEYLAIAEDLKLTEWNPVVWIGRLFALDNDFGEHWFDSWDARETRRAAAEQHGIDLQTLFVVNPERLQDGSDGPVDPAPLRALFWRDVLQELHLSMELLAEKARHFNEISKARLDLQDLYLEDLEERIARWYARPEPPAQ